MRPEGKDPGAHDGDGEQIRGGVHKKSFPQGRILAVGSRRANISGSLTTKNASGFPPVL